MRNFLIKTVQIFILALLVIIFLQTVIYIRTHDKSTTGHDNLEITSNNNSDLIFMGSSRCWSHFDPMFFEKEFNLKSTNIGVDGHSELSMVYFRLTDYLKYNTPPKYAILSFDPFISAGDIYETTKNSVHRDNFARYAYKPFNEDWNTVKHLGFNNWEKYFPMYSIFKYKQVSNCLFQNNLSTYVKYGYERHDKDWDTHKEYENRNLAINYSITANKAQVKTALNKLKALCATHDIKLICMQTPVYKSVYDIKSFQITKNISTELNILFIDANYDSIRAEKKYFYNSNHLNIRGVEAMNSRLKLEQKLIETLK